MQERREGRPQSDECKLERVVCDQCGARGMHLFGKKKKQPEASTSDTASAIAKMKEQKSLMEKKRELHEHKMNEVRGSDKAGQCRNAVRDVRGDDRS